MEEDYGLEINPVAPIAFKGISWDTIQNRPVSWHDNEFYWPKDGKVKAEMCDGCYASDEHFLNHSCGMYGSWQPDMASFYKRKLGLMLLVQPGIRCAVHEKGFRSYTMKVVASVYAPRLASSMSTSRASRYFNIPIIHELQAATIVDLVNIQAAAEYNFEYELQFLTREQLQMFAGQIFIPLVIDRDTFIDD